MYNESLLLEKDLFKHIKRDLFDSNGFVDYQKLRKNLHVKVKSLAAALGKTPRAIEKNPRSDNIQKGLRKIVYIMALLKEMLESENDINIWMKAPNPDFGGLSPWEVIQDKDMDAVIDYLADIKKGALT